MPYYRFDLHTHTTYSDGLSTPKEMIRQAKKVGLDGIAITEHDNLKSLQDIGKDDNFLCVPGMEVTALKGHVLAFGVNEPIPKQRSVEETVDSIHERGGTAVCAHPFNIIKKFSNHQFYKYKFDAYESLNANAFSFVNDFLKNFYLAREMPQIGATDSHHYSTVGKAYTIVEADELSLESILQSIRNGKIAPRGSTINTYEFYKTLLKTYTQRKDKTSSEDLGLKIVQTMLSYLPENIGYAIFVNLNKFMARQQRKIIEPYL